MKNEKKCCQQNNALVKALQALLRLSLSEVPKDVRPKYKKVWRRANSIIEEKTGKKTGFIID